MLIGKELVWKAKQAKRLYVQKSKISMQVPSVPKPSLPFFPATGEEEPSKKKRRVIVILLVVLLLLLIGLYLLLT